MTHYRITGRGDGEDYGIWKGETPEDAVRALLRDAGSDEEPIMENWIVEEVEVQASDGDGSA